MNGAQAPGVKAHRAGANDEERDCGVGNRQTKRDAVRARPADEARFAMRAGAICRAHPRRAMTNEAEVMRPNVPVEGRAATTLAKLKPFAGASPRTPG